MRRSVLGNLASPIALVPGIRVFVAWGGSRTLRVVAAVLFGTTLVWAFGSFWHPGVPFVSLIPDAPHYYAGGERLNAGHDLYAYGPGDRVLPMDPFGFAGPFLYPPLLGTVWRPLALLPYDFVVIGWWVFGAIVLIATVAWLIRHAGLPTVGMVAALSIPLAATAWSGNIQPVLTPAVVAAWLLLDRGRDRAAGAILAVTALLKVSPIFLCWWLLVTGRRRAAVAAIVVGVAGIAVSLAGSGVRSYAEYLHVASIVGSVGGVMASPTGIAGALGAPESVRILITPAIGLIGAIGVLALRKRPAAAWTVATVAGVLASTAVNLTNVTLLLAAFLPFGTWLRGRSGTLEV